MKTYLRLLAIMFLILAAYQSSNNEFIFAFLDLLMATGLIWASIRE